LDSDNSGSIFCCSKHSLAKYFLIWVVWANQSVHPDISRPANKTIFFDEYHPYDRAFFSNKAFDVELTFSLIIPFYCGVCLNRAMVHFR
jgi:hypothetical protein